MLSFQNIENISQTPLRPCRTSPAPAGAANLLSASHGPHAVHPLGYAAGKPASVPVKKIGGFRLFSRARRAKGHKRLSSMGGFLQKWICRAMDRCPVITMTALMFLMGAGVLLSVSLVTAALALPIMLLISA